jgi:hypothetical protein
MGVPQMLVALVTTHCLFARLKHSSDIVLYENVIFIIFQFGRIGSKITQDISGIRTRTETGSVKHYNKSSQSL